MRPVPRPVRPASPEPLTALIYELLDAHLDTLELAKDLLEERWRAHLDYLRALQRAARKLIASAPK